MDARSLVAVVCLGLAGAGFGCGGDDDGAGPDAGATGGLVISAEQEVLRLRTGGTAIVPVTIERSGDFAGEVVVELLDLPTGVAADAETISPGETSAQVIIVSASDAPHAGPHSMTLTATAADDSGVTASFEQVLYLGGASGSVDTSFGTNGTATAQLTPVAVVQSMAVDEQGRVVVAGIEASPNDNVVIARFTVGGELDESFGEGGLIRTTFGGDYAVLRSMVVRPGRIQIAGVGIVGEMATPVIRQYNGAGLVDTAYGDGGDVATTQPLGMVARGDGLLANDDGALVALDASGDVDSSFDLDTPPVSWSNFVVDGEEYLLLGAYSTESCQLARFDYNGGLDGDFGTAGVAEYTGVASDYVGNLEVVASPTDGVYAICNTKHPVIDFNPEYPFVFKFSDSGDLDPGFGTGGVVKPATEGTIRTAIADSSGRLLVFGTDGAQGPFIWRYLANGSPDENFADSGTLALVGSLSARVVAYEPAGERLVLCVEDFGDGTLSCTRVWL